MADDENDRLETELCALLIADLRTSGVTTAEEMHVAAAVSLRSLTGEAQAVSVTRDAIVPGRFDVAIKGPTFFGHVRVSLPGLPTPR